MLFDLNAFGSNASTRNYDVCISGAGPAGITIARILANAGKNVALFEGGGLELTETSQDLYHGKNIGLNNWDAIYNCRLRYFGGTSNHWGGRCSFFYHLYLSKTLFQSPFAFSIKSITSLATPSPPLIADT